MHLPFRGTVTIWRVLLLFICVLVTLPVVVIVSSLFMPYSSVWQHLITTVLNDYLINSFILVVGVGIGALLLGVSTAWLTTTYEFPGRRFFEWALLLPMAMPAYILAYSYTGLLDFSGPVQSFLRASFDWGYRDYWFPEIRSLGGAIFVLSLVLYPYVYFIVRVAFMEQSRALLEVSRSLGHGIWATFFKVALPVARPAIVAGVSLAMMEALADYGTVQYFGVSTFTTGIFRTWFGLGELNVAAQLSAILLLFVLAVVVFERYSRRQMKYYHATSSQKHIERITPKLKIGVTLFCGTILLAGFVLPVLQLIFWALNHWRDSVDDAFLSLVYNSFLLASMAALICLMMALCFIVARRIRDEKFESITMRFGAIGYAVPGTVIAVGVMIPLAYIDEQVDRFFTHYFDWSTGLLLSGSIVILLIAYTSRFLAVALHTLESGVEKIRPTIDYAAQSLGCTQYQMWMRVHFPLMRASILTALLLVFVDVLKELPATLVLRPFNFNTLAVKAFELASDERLAEASLPSLAIVLIGLLPVYIMVRSMKRGQA